MKKVSIIIIFLVAIVILLEYFLYQYQSKDPLAISELEKDFSENNKKIQLIVEENNFKELYQKIKKEETTKEKEQFYKILETLKNQLNQPNLEYQIGQDGKMLLVAKELKKRIETLGLVYKISLQYQKDETNSEEIRNKAEEFKNICIERAEQELLNVANLSTWNPDHYLDVAEMAYGVSLGYIWFNDELTNETKQILEKALLEKALITSMEKKSQGIFYKRTNNWNLVCNSAIGVAAIALLNTNYSLEEYEIQDKYIRQELEKSNKTITSHDLAQAIVQRSLKNLEIGKKQLEPNGGFLEGVEYWEYGNNYMMFFISSVCLTYGTDYVFLEDEKIKQTTLFPIYITGKSTTNPEIFNYSDSKNKIPDVGCSLWFANYYTKQDNKNEYLKYMSNYYAYKYREKYSMYEILFYEDFNFNEKTNEQIEKEIKKYKVPEDKIYNGQEVATLRTDFTNEEGIFVGVKGGNNKASHGDLDNGTIVLDAFGIRWIEDLGPGDYNQEGYWEMERWNYYKKRAEGHSTFSIEPTNSTTGDQNLEAFSEIVESNFGEDVSSVKIDLTNIIKDNKGKIERTVELQKNNKQVIISDVLENLDDLEIYSFLNITEGIEVELSQDGKIATLKKDGKSMRIGLKSNYQDFRFEIMPKETLNTSLKEKNSEIIEGNKLGIKINTEGKSLIKIDLIFEGEN